LAVALLFSVFLFLVFGCSALIGFQSSYATGLTNDFRNIKCNVFEDYNNLPSLFMSFSYFISLLIYLVYFFKITRSRKRYKNIALWPLRLLVSLSLFLFPFLFLIIGRGASLLGVIYILLLFYLTHLVSKKFQREISQKKVIFFGAFCFLFLAFPLVTDILHGSSLENHKKDKACLDLSYNHRNLGDSEPLTTGESVEEKIERENSQIEQSKTSTKSNRDIYDWSTIIPENRDGVYVDPGIPSLLEALVWVVSILLSSVLYLLFLMRKQYKKFLVLCLVLAFVRFAAQPASSSEEQTYEELLKMIEEK
jgi:hypothetical protein